MSESDDWSGVRCPCFASGFVGSPVFDKVLSEEDLSLDVTFGFVLVFLAKSVADARLSKSLADLSPLTIADFFDGASFDFDSSSTAASF
jgi:hypothetical protein